MVTTWNVSATTNEENTDRCLKEKMRRVAEQSLTKTIANVDKRGRRRSGSLQRRRQWKNSWPHRREMRRRSRRKKKKTKKKQRGWWLGMIL
jgi:hypothetical protein